ncbi:hypothetical protein [Streptomyces goshikiensis]|uniref:hypothetical protein n=1 Tax=Streptomyces goshikiensis TaxID=1942 RepID=UPI00371FBE64
MHALTIAAPPHQQAILLDHSSGAGAAQPRTLPVHSTDEPVITIYGWSTRSVALGKDLSDVELRVVDQAGTVTGSYYIGRVGLRSEVQGEDGNGGFFASFYGHA